MDQWAEERRVQERELQAFTEATAFHLGKPWEYQEPGGYRWIGRIANGKAEIRLRASDQSRGSGQRDIRRIIVSGFYPGDHLPWGTKLPRITVAMSRGAETLAKEIRRRFLSKYLALYGENQKSKRENEAWLKQEDKTRAKLLDLSGGTLSAGRVIHFSGPGGCDGTIEVSGSVKIELRSVKHQEAIRIAWVLRNLAEIKEVETT
jgi:hypothetical protein